MDISTSGKGSLPSTNGEFEICNKGDAVSFDFTIDDESVTPMTLVAENDKLPIETS